MSFMYIIIKINFIMKKNIELTKKLCQQYNIHLIDHLPKNCRKPLHKCEPIPQYLLDIL